MSTSGLCRCSTRAQEVGPVPVFVSEENPGALASSLYCTRGGRQPAYLFVQPCLCWLACSPPLHRYTTASLYGYELANILRTLQKKWSRGSCDSPLDLNRLRVRHFSTESRFLLVIAALEGRWEGRVGGGKSEVSSAPVYPPDNDKEKHAGGRL